MPGKGVVTVLQNYRPSNLLAEIKEVSPYRKIIATIEPVCSSNISVDLPI